MFKIWKSFAFSASHQLTHLTEENHPCKRLHGHNYVLRVGLRAYTLDENGFVFDYKGLDFVKVLIDETLDHRHLNDALGSSVGTTAERIAYALFIQLKIRLPKLFSVTILETDKTMAEYTEE